MNDPKSDNEDVVEGASAYLTIITVMCGFAFAGFILYLGVSPTTPVRIVAAGLLLMGFIVLLYGSFAVASQIDVAAKKKYRAMEHYGVESTWSLLLGLPLLLAAVCVMSFAWSVWLGAVATALAVVFTCRFVWAAIHELLMK
jgi:hypothetical protein